MELWFFFLFLSLELLSLSLSLIWTINYNFLKFKERNTSSNIISKYFTKRLTFYKTWIFLPVLLQFNTTLWFLRSVRTALIPDTQKPEISGFSTAHAYKCKTKRQVKMKRRKITIVLMSHPVYTYVFEKPSSVYKNKWRKSKRSVGLWRRQGFRINWIIS